MDPGPDILYRPYRDEDRPGVIDILYRTGFMGEDLTGTDRFNDRVLFALVNMDGYLRYEKENVCVAQARDTGQVLGYIMGTADTLSYQKTFRRRMYGRIALRVVLVSSWRYPESFQALLHWGWTFSMDHERPFYADYPADRLRGLLSRRRGRLYRGRKKPSGQNPLVGAGNSLCASRRNRY